MSSKTSLKKKRKPSIVLTEKGEKFAEEVVLSPEEEQVIQWLLEAKGDDKNVKD